MLGQPEDRNALENLGDGWAGPLPLVGHLIAMETPAVPRLSGRGTLTCLAPTWFQLPGFWASGLYQGA